MSTLPRHFFATVLCLGLAFPMLGVPGPVQAEVTAFKQAIAESASVDEDIAEFYRDADYAPLWTGEDDVHVARRAAQNMTDDQIAALETLLDAQTDTVSDPQAFRVADFRFHEAIWIGCGNGFLKRIGESLNSLGLEFRRRASENAAVLEQSLMDHRKLFEALKARDPSAAADAAEEHMQNVYRSTVAQDTKGRDT